MARVIKNIKVSWNWTGDINALKGFNIAITPDTYNSPTVGAVVTNTIYDKNVRDYIFREVVLDDSKTYKAWVQALYEGKDSDWVTANNFIVSDDGSATIATSKEVDEKIAIVPKIIGGVRNLVFNYSGTLQTALTDYDVIFFKDGQEITAPVGTSYSWTCGGAFSGAGTAKTFKPTANYSTNDTWVQVEVTINGKKYIDRIAVAVSKEGLPAYTGILTNENVTVTANNDGTGYSLTNTGGTFEVYRGNTKLTSGVTYAVSGLATKNGLTITINSTTGVYSLSGSSWNTDMESFTLTATVEGVTITKIYTISKTKIGATGATGPQGPTGTPGNTYYLVITGGTRNIVYDGLGQNPTPTTSSVFDFELYKNGAKITSGIIPTWTVGGHLTTGTASGTQYTPGIRSSYSSSLVDTWIEVNFTYDGISFKQRVPVTVSLDYRLLPWVQDWNDNYVLVGSNKILTPKIFAGSYTDNKLTGVAIGREPINGTSVGIVGYKDGTAVYSFSTDGTLTIGKAGGRQIILDANGNAVLPSIRAQDMTIGNNVNILPYNLASFESYSNNENLNFSKQTNVTSVTASNEQFLDGQLSMKIVTNSSCTDGYVYLAETGSTFNIPVKPNTRYCYSFYAKTTSTTAVNIQGYIRVNDTNQTHYNPINGTIVDTEGWKRFYGVFTTPNNVSACNIRVDVDGASKTVYFDCFQLEELTSYQSEPSMWTCPSATIINGNNIITGTITADKISAAGINAEKITSGTLLVKNGVGGTAIIRVLNNLDEECVRLDEEGITVTNGRISVMDANNNVIITPSGIPDYVRLQEYNNKIAEIDTDIDDIYSNIDDVNSNITSLNSTISSVNTNLTNNINAVNTIATQVKTSIDNLTYYVSYDTNNVYIGKNDFNSKITVNKDKISLVDSGTTIAEVSNKKITVNNITSNNYVTIGSFKLEQYVNGSNKYLLFRSIE